LIEYVKSGEGWLTRNLPSDGERNFTACPEVEARAKETQAFGDRPLWEGYRGVQQYPTSTVGVRSSNQVRTPAVNGTLFAWLAEQRAPDIVVEFGTAFGVSGMYWLTGLKRAGGGWLFTYEPNTDWSAIADASLAAISPDYTLTEGMFEDNAAATLAPASCDIAFIDAIHTSDFVLRQWQVLTPFMRPGGLVLFDDIGFSKDMAQCWDSLAAMPEAKASLRFGNRLGIVELA
jgi:predicted O-methyltransferase YrrM